MQYAEWINIWLSPDFSLIIDACFTIEMMLVPKYAWAKMPFGISLKSFTLQLYQGFMTIQFLGLHSHLCIDSLNGKLLMRSIYWNIMEIY